MLVRAIGHCFACPIPKTEQTRARARVLSFDDQRPNPTGGSAKLHGARQMGCVEYLVIHMSQ